MIYVHLKKQEHDFEVIEERHQVPFRGGRPLRWLEVNLRRAGITLGKTVVTFDNNDAEIIGPKVTPTGKGVRETMRLILTHAALSAKKQGATRIEMTPTNRHERTVARKLGFTFKNHRGTKSL